MSNTLRVTAPYVTLKVTDQVRGTVLIGFYEGAVVENVDDDSAKHHIKSGLAEKVSKDAEPAGPPITPMGEEDPDPDTGKAPKSVTGATKK